MRLFAVSTRMAFVYTSVVAGLYVQKSPHHPWIRLCRPIECVTPMLEIEMLRPLRCHSLVQFSRNTVEPENGPALHQLHRYVPREATVPFTSIGQTEFSPERMMPVRPAAVIGDEESS